ASPGAFGLVPDSRDTRAQVVRERLGRRPGDEHVVARETDPGGRGSKQPYLAYERRPVERALTRERDARPEEDEVQRAARVAQVPVRDELERVERRLAAEHLPLEDDRPAMLEHPHLAPVLVLDVARRLLVAGGVRLEHRPSAALDHQVREGEV